MRGIFPLLYWLGLLLVLGGIGARFWLAEPRWALGLALAGLVLMLAGRSGQTARRLRSGKPGDQRRN